MLGRLPIAADRTAQHDERHQQHKFGAKTRKVDFLTDPHTGRILSDPAALFESTVKFPAEAWCGRRRRRRRVIIIKRRSRIRRRGRGRRRINRRRRTDDNNTADDDAADDAFVGARFPSFAHTGCLVTGPIAFDKLCAAACAAVRTYRYASEATAKTHNTWAFAPCPRCSGGNRDVLKPPRAVVVQINNANSGPTTGTARLAKRR